MRILDRFRKKEEKKIELPSLPPLPTETTTETKEEKPKESEDEVKLILTKIESLKLNIDILSEKIDKMEKMLKEIYDMAKS